MDILVNDVSKVATGLVLRDNFDISRYLKITYTNDDGEVVPIMNYSASRDNNNFVFLSLPQNLQSKVISVNINRPNSFFKRDSESDIDFFKRLSYSFFWTLEKAPKPVLREGEVRIAYVRDLIPLRHEVGGGLSLALNSFVFKGAFYFLSHPVLYKKEVYDTTTTKPTMFLFKRTSEASENFFAFTPSLQNPMVDTVRVGDDLTLLVFNLNAGMQKIRNVYV